MFLDFCFVGAKMLTNLFCGIVQHIHIVRSVTAMKDSFAQKKSTDTQDANGEERFFQKKSNENHDSLDEVVTSNTSSSLTLVTQPKELVLSP
jgi:hypothetical protein